MSVQGYRPWKKRTRRPHCHKLGSLSGLRVPIGMPFDFGNRVSMSFPRGTPEVGNPDIRLPFRVDFAGISMQYVSSLLFQARSPILKTAPSALKLK